MCVAKLTYPAPTIARMFIACVTGMRSPAKQELNAHLFVYALLEDRSMNFLI